MAQMQKILKLLYLVNVFNQVGTTVRQVTLNVIEQTGNDWDLVKKYFKFRHKYVPKEDRIEMLLKRIPKKIERKELLFLDLVKQGERHLLVKGGLGGFGNPHFATPLMPGDFALSRTRHCGKR